MTQLPLITHPPLHTDSTLSQTAKKGAALIATALIVIAALGVAYALCAKLGADFAGINALVQNVPTFSLFLAAGVVGVLGITGFTLLMRSCKSATRPGQQQDISATRHDPQALVNAYINNHLIDRCMPLRACYWKITLPAETTGGDPIFALLVRNVADKPFSPLLIFNTEAERDHTIAQIRATCVDGEEIVKLYPQPYIGALFPKAGLFCSGDELSKLKALNKQYYEAEPQQIPNTNPPCYVYPLVINDLDESESPYFLPCRTEEIRKSFLATDELMDFTSSDALYLNSETSEIRSKLNVLKSPPAQNNYCFYPKLKTETGDQVSLLEVGFPDGHRSFCFKDHEAAKQAFKNNFPHLQAAPVTPVKH